MHTWSQSDWRDGENGRDDIMVENSPKEKNGIKNSSEEGESEQQQQKCHNKCCCLVTKSYPTVCDPIDCSSLGSSVLH